MYLLSLDTEVLKCYCTIQTHPIALSEFRYTLICKADLLWVESTMAALSHLEIKEKITNISVQPLAEGSPYIRPMRMTFSHNDRERKWDLLHGHDAVAVLMHNTSRDCIILVRQFRPPVHFHRTADKLQAESFKLGYTLEVRCEATESILHTQCTYPPHAASGRSS